ncbi:MAG: HypC/HybG/HupF family hydrogenase formation chaperone [Frankia sp.]|nr:HypC/HybG/HupF family hydrogenase formation chaperone [Frankia sp.]
MCLGIPGRIVEIWDDRGTRMAVVDFGGVTKTVCLAYLPEAVVGEYTIVHAGFGITLLDERSALETLAMFAELGLLDEELADADADAGAGAPAVPASAGAGGADVAGDGGPGGTAVAGARGVAR